MNQWRLIEMKMNASSRSRFDFSSSHLQPRIKWHVTRKLLDKIFFGLFDCIMCTISKADRAPMWTPSKVGFACCVCLWSFHTNCDEQIRKFFHSDPGQTIWGRRSKVSQRIAKLDDTPLAKGKRCCMCDFSSMWICWYVDEIVWSYDRMNFHDFHAGQDVKIPQYAQRWVSSRLCVNFLPCET